MSLWKNKALEAIRDAGLNPDTPEFVEVRSADSVMMFWVEIGLLLSDYASKDPDHPIFRHMFRFARWCVSEAPREEDAGNDPFSACCVAFYEHLPTHEHLRPLITLHMSWLEIDGMRKVWRYHMDSDEELEQFLADAKCSCLRLNKGDVSAVFAE